MRRAIYRSAIFCAAFACAPGAAHAGDFCSAFADVIATSVEFGDADAPRLTDLDMFSPDDACGDSLLLSGASATYCMRAFAYRSAQASTLYDALGASLNHCPHVADVTDAAPVGHPDSHAHRTYQFTAPGGVWRIDLSLKDKAALNQTLLTLQAAQPE